MTQFDEREKAFEKKFGMDEEHAFHVAVRTARLFGLWAAAQMEMSADSGSAYAAEITDIAVAKSGHEEIFKKIEHDFADKGINHTRHRLEKEWNALEREVK